MNKWFATVLLLVSITFFSCGSVDKKVERFIAEGEYAGEYWPATEWRTCRPEEVGMNSQKLAKAFQYTADLRLKTEGVLVIRKGYIVGEAYMNGFSEGKRHKGYSIGKSVTCALTGIVIEQGLIRGIDEKICNYYEKWQEPGIDPAKKQMTIRHLLTMTGGLEWNEEDYYINRDRNDVFRIYSESRDFIQYVLEKPVRTEPGKTWYYSSGETILLSGLIEKVTGMPFAQFADRYLFMPLGMSSVTWESDPSGRTLAAWGIEATVRDYAKFGYLFLKKGRWDSLQVVPENWVSESTRPASDGIRHYGYLWWLAPAFKDYPGSKIPPDTIIAVGIYIQMIYVIPSQDLVVVRVGNDPATGDVLWNSVDFLELVLDAINQ
ncbi:MAG: serine hydrolase [Spirochaetota bacterium]